MSIAISCKLVVSWMTKTTGKQRVQISDASERLGLLKCWNDLLFQQKKVHDRFLGNVKSIEKFSILSWEICHGFSPSASDLASELELPRETVRRLLEDGDLRGHRLGVKGPWRITEEAVAEFLKRFESPVEDRDAKP